ncbi:MAG: hypothetical protein CFE45_23575 [Burkholderiales bacterium PBB5]|nr:MAG: hypothetical protein CFE45_23575 [Burkholderiales bacterium PBB5]
MEATRPLASGVQRPVDNTIDFNIGERTQPRPAQAAPGRSPAPDLDFDSLTLPFDDEPTRPGAPAGGDTTLDFRDFEASGPGGLSSRLHDLDAEPGDPLARKLELAEEFRQIGDMEGARDLLEEVVAKAGGTLRAKAQAMLDALA